YRFVDRNNLKRSNILKASETKFLSESQYDVIVCDSITGTFTSKKGNLWLNLGKPYPNQDLSIFVSSKNLENFTLDLEALQNRRECFLGKIKNLGGSRTLQIFSQDQIVKDL
ncbi:MAG: hypothetical protein MRY83_23275, partial [Flavobacteriales bacterium]|nr:hypothetical protein [Flavobacteriales bacterium]